MEHFAAMLRSPIEAQTFRVMILDDAQRMKNYAGRLGKQPEAANGGLQMDWPVEVGWMDKQVGGEASM